MSVMGPKIKFFLSQLHANINIYLRPKTSNLVETAQENEREKRTKHYLASLAWCNGLNWYSKEYFYSCVLILLDVVH